jgi:hypothetical protein
MSLQAFWVHGNAVQPEYPDRLESFTRKGWGTVLKVKPKTNNWIHIPFTTPVLIDGVRPTLKKVFIFYKTQDVLIDRLHIYDGKKKVRSSEVFWKGDYSASIDNAHNAHGTVTSVPIIIYYGMEVCVRIKHFSGEDRSVLFTCAGADFEL